MMSHRADIDFLIAKHADKLNELRLLLTDPNNRVEKASEKKEPLTLGPKQDDVYLVRFLLSHEKPAIAADYVRRDLKCRKEIAPWLEADSPPDDAMTREVFKVDTDCTSKDGTLLFIVYGGTVLTKLKQQKDPIPHIQACKKWSIWMKERYFQKCDEMTRKTRKVHKIIFLNDMTGFSMWLNPKIGKTFGESSKLSEVIHPQLLEVQVIVNVPPVFNVFFNFMKPFVSKKVLEKIELCGAAEQSSFLARRIGLENLPRDICGQMRA